MLTCEDFCYVGLNVSICGAERLLIEKNYKQYKANGNRAVISYWYPERNEAEITLSFNDNTSKCVCILPLNLLIPIFEHSLEKQLDDLERRKALLNLEINMLKDLIAIKGNAYSPLEATDCIIRYLTDSK